MSLQRILIGTGLVLSSLLVHQSSIAHDFWLSPDTYHNETSAVVPVSVKIGHPEDRLNWPVSPNRVVALRTISRNGVADQQTAVAKYGSDKTLPIEIDGAGLHILTIETTNAFSELPAEKFENYLTEEGLTLIRADRILRSQTESPGTELYSRRGKALLQVGPVSEEDTEILRRPLGLTLEVIAMDHPGQWRADEPLAVKILYRGKPVAGVMVELVNISLDDAKTVSQKADLDGMVFFDHPGPGEWMFHTVWGDTAPVSDQADYNTIFSSLSFELP